MRDRFIWWNKNVAILSGICGALFVVMYGAEQALFGTLFIYFACLALWNLRDSL